VAGCAQTSSSAPGAKFGKILQQDGRAVREPGDKLELAPHSGDVVAQGRDQQVAALFDARDTVLADAEQLRYALLSHLASFAQVLKRHLLAEELVGSRFDLGAARGRQLVQSPVIRPKGDIEIFGVVVGLFRKY
jgi:hypothetical protein